MWSSHAKNWKKNFFTKKHMVTIKYKKTHLETTNVNRRHYGENKYIVLI